MGEEVHQETAPLVCDAPDDDCDILVLVNGNLEMCFVEVPDILWSDAITLVIELNTVHNR
jgi:hypothetical protein